MKRIDVVTFIVATLLSSEEWGFFLDKTQNIQARYIQAAEPAYQDQPP
jgi:hypothetical protein